jgi:hypothetical protein
MATIGSRTFNLIGDKYLSLANEEYLRQLSIGSNWNKLRLGAMVALAPNGTSNLVGCSLMLGLCSAATPFANTTGYAAASTGNFLGIDVVTDNGGGTGPGTFTYNAGTGNPFFSCVFSGARRRVATTSTFAVTNSYSPAIAQTNGSLQRRSVLLLEITKGSPNYSLKIFTNNAAQAEMDFTTAHFLDGLEQSGTPIINGQTMVQNSGLVTIACSESTGVFDTVNLFWNKSAFPIEVYALAAFRMS